MSSPHLLRAHVTLQPRKFLYVVTEYVAGQSLRQRMRDHPKPDLETVRNIVDQMIKGLRALHRREMIHCDLRPENVMIDQEGTVKIIDFGSVRVAGLAEAVDKSAAAPILGAVQYAAPEWLAGQLPYGADAARVQSPAQQRALRYRSARSPASAVPAWIDGALRTALHPNPAARYDAMSEFMNDLRAPNRRFQLERHAPLLERDPVLFWKGLSIILALIICPSFGDAWQFANITPDGYATTR